MPGQPDATSFIEFLNPEAIPYVATLLVATFLVVAIIRRLVTRMAERWMAQRLVIKNLGTLLAFLLYAVAVVIAIGSLFKLSPQAILAASGTLAVVAAFALKDVAASFMAGISILINKPFQVGDRIAFGGFYGEVKEIGLRSVRLVTLDDNLVTIPSNKFLTEPVASANAGALDCMVVIPFYLRADADHQRARQIVQDALLASKYLYLGKPTSVLFSNHLSDDARVVVVLTAKAYVYDTRHEKAFASDVTDRVLRAFRGEGIPVPGALGENGGQTVGG